MGAYRGTQSTDRALVERVKLGDELAIQTLFDQNQGRLFGYINGLVRDKDVVDDLVEETFIRAIFHIDKYKAKSSLSTWLHGIARNLTYDYCRKRRVRERRMPTTYLENYADVGTGQIMVQSPSKTPEDTVGDEELHSRVRHALDDAFGQLTGKRGERQRTVLTLHYYSGLTYTEIAADLGVSENAVKCALHRARSSLTDKLKEKGITREVVEELFSAA